MKIVKQKKMKKVIKNACIRMYKLVRSVPGILVILPWQDPGAYF